MLINHEFHQIRLFLSIFCFCFCCCWNWKHVSKNSKIRNFLIRLLVILRAGTLKLFSYYIKVYYEWGPYFYISEPIYKSTVYEKFLPCFVEATQTKQIKTFSKSSSKFFPPPGFILSFYNLWEHHKSFKTMICNTSSSVQHHSKPFHESRVGEILMLRRLDRKTWLVCI